MSNTPGSIISHEHVTSLEMTGDQEERELASWFAKMTAPCATAVVIEPEVSHHEPLPYRRSKPRRVLWHGAGPMSRRPMAK